jgi:hypothetical protein
MCKADCFNHLTKASTRTGFSAGAPKPAGYAKRYANPTEDRSVKNGNSHNQQIDGFPVSDEYIDFAGKKRTFDLELTELPHGYVCIARESGKDGDGYQFQSFSRIDPSECLAQLRRKIPKVLSVRHLIQDEGSLQPGHDRLRGRIAYGGVVIDGRLIAFEELVNMMQAYEGFQFDLRFVDPSDDIFA